MLGCSREHYAFETALVKTPYHSAYWAHALTLQGPPGTVENLSRSIANARVDLNPHQVDAALFAVRSPFTKGVLLADEVGLGKTIEAGIVIAQRWAERKRRILLILPATLRKQWQQEIEEKFSIPTTILETASFNLAKKNGSADPFEVKNRIVICSYHFASAKAVELRQHAWDLVVIDEAHRLRNVYKPTNKMANAIVGAIAGTPTLLLTATPLQNSLLELYGLVSVIDPHVFGDIVSFREQFTRGNDEGERNRELKRRLAPLCRRTLRKQVLGYIRFTQRVPITQDFLPTDAEHTLYENVSAYLQREVLHALPASQRTLMTLILRKLLASSTFAIAGTLRSLIRRLESLETETLPVDDEDIEGVEVLQEEWADEDAPPPPPDIDRASLQQELAELRKYADLAESIGHNAKGDALLKALEAAFSKTEALGAPRKAVIFTESRRTQKYLYEFLGEHGFARQMVLMNGSNTDADSRAIYQAWAERHRGSDLLSGSKSADTKAAIVEEFRDRATLLIATESAAEGVNLQFCSLVVNYDLPWNPQRIEQRIGRCHRYGQQHDVVVVNFINRRNEADQRVFQLLAEKFRLFDGVFGASDEVLGALESGVDIERRIVQVYQECRTAEEIQTAFDRLQHDLDEQIGTRMDETRRNLLENFDEEVHHRIKLRDNESRTALSHHQQLLFELTREELGKQAKWDELRFDYDGPLGAKGTYSFDWRDAEARDGHFYRPEHPLARTLIERALGRDLGAVVTLRLRASTHRPRISALEALQGSSGWLAVSKLSITGLEPEDRLILTAVTDDGHVLDQDLAAKIFSIDADVLKPAPPTVPAEQLESETRKHVSSYMLEVEQRNASHFDEEVLKLDNWAEDLKFGLEREIKDLDREMKEIRRGAALAASLADKLEAQKKLKALDEKRKRKRRELFEAQDAIDDRRDALIKDVEAQLKQTTEIRPLFTLRWEIA
jgi:adenine-specific DNA-methyltransferase